MRITEVNIKKEEERQKVMLMKGQQNLHMEKWIEKGDVLIEALPYIQRFNRKIIVVKYGGSAMLDEDFMTSVIQDITLLKLVGFKPIIVHGGGKAISRHIDRLGMDTKFINGLRVTDDETLDAALMLYPWKFSSKPIGHTIGRKSFSNKSNKISVFTFVTSPTYPISSPSDNFFLTVKSLPSLPLIPIALTPNCSTDITLMLMMLPVP